MTAHLTNHVSRLHAAGTVVALLLGGARSASADECALTGEPLLARSAVLWDSAEGGAELARFSGGRVSLTVAALPAEAGGRLSVRTSGFRLDGFVAGRDLPVFTTRAIPAVQGHAWIGAGRRVTALAARDGRAQIEQRATYPVVATLRAFTSCRDLTLAERVPPGYTPEGGMRGYALDKERAELLDAPRGDLAHSVERALDASFVLFFGREREGGHVHVEHHGEIILDGWIRASDLRALPPGETLDQIVPPPARGGSPSLSLQGTARAVTATAPVVLRASASDLGRPIGGLEPGTEVLVLDVVAGWASVVPKSLGVMPAGEGHFWAKARELGL